MLDQPVPNPLAKNPNVYTHKVFAAVGLILIGTIIAVAGIWYYVNGRFIENQYVGVNDKVNPLDKVEYQPRKIATVTSTKKETGTWKEYKGEYYSFKYPGDFTISNDYGVGVKIDSSDLKKYYPKADGEVERISTGSQFEVLSVENSATDPTSIEEFDKNALNVVEPVYLTIDGVKSKKLVTYNPYDHENEISVILFKGNRSYIITQSFSVTKNDIDSSDFDTLISTFKFL